MDAPNQSDISDESAGNFSDLRLVMVLSPAVQQKFKNYTPEMTAAVSLAMNDNNRKNLVERPEGIYLSSQCKDRISSYLIWLTTDSEIIITRGKLQGQTDEPKEDSQKFLNQRLPKAQKLGGINSFHYALGLASTFGLDQNRLIVNRNQIEAEVYPPMKKKISYAYLVGRKEVEAGDTSLLIWVANDRITSYQETGIMNSIFFGISGYDDDSRSLCTIPEVRSWCARLCEEFPMLALLEPTTVQWFLPCIVDIKVINTNENGILIQWPKDWYALIEPFAEKAFALIWSLSNNDTERRRLRDECVKRCREGFRLLGLQ